MHCPSVRPSGADLPTVASAGRPADKKGICSSAGLTADGAPVIISAGLAANELSCISSAGSPADRSCVVRRQVIQATLAHLFCRRVHLPNVSLTSVRQVNPLTSVCIIRRQLEWASLARVASSAEQCSHTNLRQ